jgi:hypothetical protein
VSIFKCGLEAGLEEKPLVLAAVGAVDMLMRGLRYLLSAPLKQLLLAQGERL